MRLGLLLLFAVAVVVLAAVPAWADLALRTEAAGEILVVQKAYSDQDTTNSATLSAAYATELQAWVTKWTVALTTSGDWQDWLCLIGNRAWADHQTLWTVGLLYLDTGFPEQARAFMQAAIALGKASTLVVVASAVVVQ